MKLEKERIESFYFLKAISCFFVVSIHSSVYGIQIFPALFGIGTLCFLTITGYLLFSEEKSRELTKCTKWARKLFDLSIIVTLVYLVELIVLLVVLPCRETGMSYNSPFIRWSIVLADSHGSWVEYLLVLAKSLLMTLVFGSGICITLWYLTAVWESLLIIRIVLRYCPKLLYGFPLLFIFAYILRTHPDLVFPENRKIALYMRLSIITALPFLSTGYLIHKHKDILLRVISVKIWLPIVLGMLLLECQIRVHAFDSYARYCFCSYPLVFLLMLACIQYKRFSVPFLNTIGEKHSANIYYFHMIIIFIMLALNIHLPYIEAIVVWLLCVPLSIIFNKMLAWCHHLKSPRKLPRDA